MPQQPQGWAPLQPPPAPSGGGGWTAWEPSRTPPGPRGGKPYSSEDFQPIIEPLWRRVVGGFGEGLSELGAFGKSLVEKPLPELLAQIPLKQQETFQKGMQSLADATQTDDPRMKQALIQAGETYVTASMFPIAGPAAAEMGEDFGADPARATGKSLALLATASPEAAVGAVKGLARVPLRAAGRTSVGEALAETAEKGAVKRFSDVVTPKYGRDKPEYLRKADKAAEVVLRDPEARHTFSAEGLQDVVDRQLADLRTQQADVLDNAIVAQKLPFPYETRPIIRALRAERDKWFRSGSSNQPQVGVGREARVAALDTAIDRVVKLGKQADLRVLRDILSDFDGQAQAGVTRGVYATDPMNLDRVRQSAFGYADAASAVRNYLSKNVPGLKDVNAAMHTYLNASEALHATDVARRVRPSLGRRGIEASVTAIGELLRSGDPVKATGAGAGAVAIDAAMTSGYTPKLATARSLMKLRDALLGGSGAQVEAQLAILRQNSPAPAGVRKGIMTMLRTAPEAYTEPEPRVMPADRVLQAPREDQPLDISFSEPPPDLPARPQLPTLPQGGPAFGSAPPNAPGPLQAPRMPRQRGGGPITVTTRNGMRFQFPSQEAADAFLKAMGEQ